MIPGLRLCKLGETITTFTMMMMFGWGFLSAALLAVIKKSVLPEKCPRATFMRESESAFTKRYDGEKPVAVNG